MRGLVLEKIKVNEKEFLIIKLLGKGKGGYSYLVSDDKEQYVVKQIHHEPCDYYKFGDKLQSEINDYKRLYNAGIKMPKMLDVDIDNERILKEYIDYECNEYMEQWNFENWGIKYWSKTKDFREYGSKR